MRARLRPMGTKPTMSKLMMAKSAETHFPSLTLTEKELPGIKELKMDQKCVLEFSAIVTGINKNKYNDGIVSATFDLKKGSFDPADAGKYRNTAEAARAAVKEAKEGSEG